MILKASEKTDKFQQTALIDVCDPKEVDAHIEYLKELKRIEENAIERGDFEGLFKMMEEMDQWIDDEVRMI